MVKVPLFYLVPVSHLLLGFGTVLFVVLDCHPGKCGDVFGVDANSVVEESNHFCLELVVWVGVLDDEFGCFLV